MKRIVVPVYVMALSLILTLVVVAWTIRSGHQHQKQLEAAAAQRTADVNQSLEAMCDRFELRDEITLSYLRVARDRYEKTDPRYSMVLADAVLALEVTQRGCRSQLPDTNG